MSPDAPLYFCDAALDPLGRGSGLAVIVRNSRGDILAAATARAPAMTNNEAEYEALLLGLQLAAQRAERQPVLLLDSQIVIGQVAGCFAVRDRKLMPRHERALRLLAQLDGATLVFIPRERNRLADALANEALQGGLEPAMRRHLAVGGLAPQPEGGEFP